MPRAIRDGQSLLGVPINAKNNGVRGDSDGTPNEINLHQVCVRLFFRADLTATRLRQYDVDVFDFHG